MCKVDRSKANTRVSDKEMGERIIPKTKIITKLSELLENLGYTVSPVAKPSDIIKGESFTYLPSD